MKTDEQFFAVGTPRCGVRTAPRAVAANNFEVSILNGEVQRTVDANKETAMPPRLKTRLPSFFDRKKRRSNLEVTKSASHITKSKSDLVKSDLQKPFSRPEITKSGLQKGLLRFEIAKSAFDLTASGFEKPLSGSDLTKSKPDITMSEPDIVIKVVKNRNLGAGWPKMGQFSGSRWTVFFSQLLKTEIEPKFQLSLHSSPERSCFPTIV